MEKLSISNTDAAKSFQVSCWVDYVQVYIQFTATQSISEKRYNKNASRSLVLKVLRL